MPKVGYIPNIHCKLHDPKAEETSIFFKLQKDGVKYKVFPGEKIRPAEWDSRRQRAKSGMNARKNLALNDRLNDWEKVIRATWEKHSAEGFTPDTFRELVYEAKQGTENLGLVEWIGQYVKEPIEALENVVNLGERQKRLLFDFLKKTDRFPHIRRMARGEEVRHMPLLDFAQDLIEQRIRKGKVKRRSVYVQQNCLRALYAFREVYGHIDYDSITWEWLEKWKEFSYSEYSFPLEYQGEVIQYEKKEWEQNYASKMLSVIKFFVSEARKRKYTSNTTVREHGFSIPTNEGNAAMLYFEDIQLIDGAALPSERLRNIRNLVIRAFCTGLRYSDWYKIGPDNIEQVNGKKVLEVWAQKTGKPVTIPMLPLFSRILQEPAARYIWNQKFNDYVKELCEFVGLVHPITWTSYAGGVQTITNPRLCDKVSSHDLRRSALTNFVLMNLQGIVNMPDGLVRLISGHSNDQQFQKYIRIGDRLKAANMTEEFLRKKKDYLFG